MANNHFGIAVDTTLQSATATGNGTTQPVGGASGSGIQLVISGTATVTFEGTVDATNYVDLQGYNIATGAWATTATASGVYWVPTAGCDLLRARISAYTSGSVTATGKAVLVPGPSPAPSLQATGIFGAVNQGSTPASIANSWRVQVTDLTNTMPTGDAVSRRIYTQGTDGTNSTPAGDALARPIFVKLSDGTAVLMPAAAALGDAAANPTTTLVGEFGHLFNNATWDRHRSATPPTWPTFPGPVSRWSLLQATGPPTRPRPQALWPWRARRPERLACGTSAPPSAWHGPRTAPPTAPPGTRPCSFATGRPAPAPCSGSGRLPA